MHAQRKHIILTVDGQKIAPLKHTSGIDTTTNNDTRTSPHPSGFNIGERIHEATSKDEHKPEQINANAKGTATLNTGERGGTDNVES